MNAQRLTYEGLITKSLSNPLVITKEQIFKTRRIRRSKFTKSLPLSEYVCAIIWNLLFLPLSGISWDMSLCPGSICVL